MDANDTGNPLRAMVERLESELARPKQHRQEDQEDLRERLRRIENQLRQLVGDTHTRHEESDR